MKCVAKIFSFLHNFQNNINSYFKKSDNSLDSTIEKERLSAFEESDLDNSLSEQLIRFYVTGNPTILLTRDEYFREAAIFVVLTQSCSLTAIRREFSVGLSRTRLLIEQLESAGIISQFGGRDNLKVLVKDENSLDRLINSLPHVEINNCIHLLDTFYEKYKEEIEKRRIEYEKLQLEIQKKTETEAIKLMMIEKILKKRLPDQEYCEVTQTGKISK